MKITQLWAAGALFCIYLNGCAVMPRQLTAEALPDMPYAQLAGNSDTYADRTIVLGGYVLSVENFKDHTRVHLLQTPLDMGQRPKSKDLSQGRLTLVYDGFLDAEVLTKDRKVTAGGRILAAGKGEPPPYPHMRIAASHIHLWPLERESYDHHGHNNWHPYPWGWRSLRYHRYRHHW